MTMAIMTEEEATACAEAWADDYLQGLEDDYGELHMSTSSPNGTIFGVGSQGNINFSSYAPPFSELGKISQSEIEAGQGCACPSCSGCNC